ncbi:hypothetical protein TNCV_1466701 [Trichonephila clavipes]|nr:hypothetical protein TNCV_1466701 [Trichonephila clavipes]
MIDKSGARAGQHYVLCTATRRKVSETYHSINIDTNERRACRVPNGCQTSHQNTAPRTEIHRKRQHGATPESSLGFWLTKVSHYAEFSRESEVMITVQAAARVLQTRPFPDQSFVTWLCGFAVRTPQSCRDLWMGGCRDHSLGPSATS